MPGKAVGARYDVLDLRYADGKPAVLRHTDGSGFAYYSSGKKAVCISASGVDGSGRSRRFSAVVHNDTGRNPIVGVFDEWGIGSAEGMLGQGDTQAPKLLISEKAITVVDGHGKVTEVPSSKGTGATDLVLRINQHLTLRHRGRTFLDFNCENVNHTFVIGEMHGEEVEGMALATEKTLLSDESTQQLQQATLKLEGVCELAKTLQVSTSQRDSKPTFAVDTSSIKDVMENLSTLKTSLSHPNLAPADLQWNTEIRLKKLLAKAHPQCPGLRVGSTSAWKISSVSGKCTEERLANAKPTVNAPKSIAQVSQLKLPELIAENTASTLLVVVCLAAYAKEQSNYARLLAEKAHAALWQKFCSKGGPLPVKLVAIELSEAGGFTDQYDVKEVPYCLMFMGGKQVYSKRLHGTRMAPRAAAAAKPRVLLVEPNPANQLKLERNLRRNGYGSDLAMDGPQASRLAQRPEGYGILLASSLLPAEQLRSLAYAVRSRQREAVILAFDSTLLSQVEAEERKPVFQECSYVFPYGPSYTGLAAILARFDVTHVDKGLACVPCTSHKQDFLDDVLGVLERGGGAVTVGDTGSGA
mmetsp:Transcript_45469/g.106267  ORF Transcript_45469/g.106267 Transcript_45469/m.106267 type:complete len:584 (+) Transcript_45469:37-1788(+)